MDATENTRSKLFTPLALTTALMTLGLIVFGAVVRVTDSGLGCGNEWPLCDGTIIPPLDNLTAWIEWLHRLFAVLIGLMGLATLTVAWRAYRNHNRAVLYATGAAAVLFAVQSALGALVVILDLPPTMVTLHLGTAMLLLGALLLATVQAWYRPSAGARAPRDHVTLLGYLTTGLSLLIILTGALVRGAGATLACEDWPLCDNAALNIVGQNQLQIVHMTHRFAVAALGLTLVMLTWYVWRARQDGLTRWLSAAALLTYLMQSGVGAMYVITDAAAVWAATHVGLAALTWALLVCFSAVETLNNGAATAATNAGLSGASTTRATG
jgi:heme A synthase